VEPDSSIDAATSPFDRRVWRVVGDPLVRGAGTAVTAPLAGIGVAVKDLFAVTGLVGAPGTDRDLLRLAHRIALWSGTVSP
jgi:hypothetical protein